MVNVTTSKTHDRVMELVRALTALQEEARVRAGFRQCMFYRSSDVARTEPVASPVHLHVDRPDMTDAVLKNILSDRHRNGKLVKLKGCRAKCSPDAIRAVAIVEEFGGRPMIDESKQFSITLNRITVRLYAIRVIAVLERLPRILEFHSHFSPKKVTLLTPSSSMGTMRS